MQLCTVRANGVGAEVVSASGMHGVPHRVWKAMTPTERIEHIARRMSGGHTQDAPVLVIEPPPWPVGCASMGDRAAQVVTRARASGRLIPQPCEECGEPETVHAHHDDYSQPIDVRWLCPKHHREWHSKNGQGAHRFDPAAEMGGAQ